MRPWLAALALTVASGPALAEGWGLRAPTTECRALESLVVFGLIDGGAGGDTTDITRVVDSGDVGLCLDWLGSYGFPGMTDPGCVEAFDVLSRNGLPEWLMGEEPSYIVAILSPMSAAACGEMLVDLTAGQ